VIRVVLSPEAEADALDAFRFYEDQRELAACEQGANDAQQRGRACRVADDQPIGEPL
jgi:plasmid stabilization system protein ParE